MLTEKKWGERIILTLAILLIASRFLMPGNVPFISDEPIFQQWADDALQSPSWRFVGMGGSSIAVAYGAAAVWIYMIPHMLSSNILFTTLFHTTVYSFCFLFLYLTIRRWAGSYIAAWALLTAASSPFLFFFSRHTWDTTFFVPFTAIMLYAFTVLVQQSQQEPWSWHWRKILPLFTIAFFSALTINIQLAIGPFILTIFLCLLAWLLKNERKNPSAWAAVLAAGFLTILLCIPYALSALDFMKKNAAILAHNTHPRWGDFRHFWWDILYTFFGLSVWKAGMFYQPVYEDFTRTAGVFFTKLFYLDPFGWLIKLSTLCTYILILKKIFSRDIKNISYLEIVTAAGFTMILLVFQYLNVPVQPHYFQSMWWVPFFLVAICLTLLSLPARKYYLIILSAMILTNMSFLALHLNYLHKNGGIRGMIHSTGIIHTRNAVKELCENLKQDSQLREKEIINIDISHIAIGDPPLTYFLRRLPDCVGHSYTVSMSPLAAADYEMRYLEEEGTDARYYPVKRK